MSADAIETEPGTARRALDYLIDRITAIERQVAENSQSIAEQEQRELERYSGVFRELSEDALDTLINDEI